MKILIAEDDIIIKRTFLEKIHWEENGFQVVGMAQDGQEAYEIALYTCPDIILTDIEMPRMSGLELAEKLQGSLEDCRFIFLTAYDKFDYAREALRLHACEYILKDSNEEEVLCAVKRAAGEIRAHNRNARLTRMGREQMIKNSIFRLLQDSVSAEESIVLCNNLEINPEECQYRVLVIRAGRDTGGTRPSEDVVSENDLKEVLEKYITGWEDKCWLINWNQYQILLTRVKTQEEDEIFHKAQGLSEFLFRRLNQSIYVGIGGLCGGKTPFSSSFDDAVFAINDDSQGNVRVYRELSQSGTIRRIREYILQNYSDPELSLNKLSEKMFLTPSYISSLFKRYTNSNFKDYLISVRMKQACRLLRFTNLKSYEISAMTGYSNPQYFSVLFKKFTGETPTQYHNKRYQEKEETEYSREGGSNETVEGQD